MEQEQYRQQERTQTKQATHEIKANTPSGYCSKCGARNEHGALYCEECGEALGQEHCSRCGSKLLPGADVCEQCGLYVKKDSCGFCGEDMDSDDAFCPECGSPRGGITCPNCSTLNHSAFCIKCYTPLTETARQEIEKARKEPAFQEVLKLSDQINELEALLNHWTETKEEPTHAPVVKTAKQLERERKNEELKQMYLNLSTGGNVNPDQTSNPVVEIVAETPKRKPIERSQSREEVEAMVRQKRQEVQKLLDSMVPDQANSPQMVRNYYTARKPPISDAVWLCNFNSCYHPNPTHCGKPFMGGKWTVVYEKIEWETHYGTM